MKEYNFIINLIDAKIKGIDKENPKNQREILAQGRAIVVLLDLKTSLQASYETFKKKK